MKKENKDLICFILILFIFTASLIFGTCFMFYFFSEGYIFTFIDLLLFNIFMFSILVFINITVFNPNPNVGNILFRFVVPIMGMVILLAFAILNIFEKAWIGLIIDIIMLGFTGYYFWKRVKHIVR